MVLTQSHIHRSILPNNCIACPFSIHSPKYMLIWGFCFLFKAKHPPIFPKPPAKRTAWTWSLVMILEPKSKRKSGSNLLKHSGGLELTHFQASSLWSKTWFASKELKKASVDLVEISGGTYETMAMMCHGWWRDWRLLFVVRFLRKHPNDELTPKIVGPCSYSFLPAICFHFFVDVLMVYPIIIAFVCPSPQKSGGQLVHLIKDLAGDLFTIKTGRPKSQKSYVEPAWNVFTSKPHSCFACVKTKIQITKRSL